VSKSGNLSNLEKSPNTKNDSTNKNITQFAESINSPAQQVNRAKTLFDKAYEKKSWEIHPTIIGMNVLPYPHRQLFKMFKHLIYV